MCLTEINGSVREFLHYGDASSEAEAQRLDAILSYKITYRYMGAKQWKALHFGNGWLSAAAVLTDTSMKSGAKVRSSSPCIEKAARRRSLLEARIRSSTLGWYVKLVKSLALIGRNCQGRRIESEATRCCHLTAILSLREPAPSHPLSREAISDGSLPAVLHVLPVTSPVEAVRAAIAAE